MISLFRWELASFDQGDTVASIVLFWVVVPLAVASTVGLLVFLGRFVFLEVAARGKAFAALWDPTFEIDFRDDSFDDRFVLEGELRPRVHPRELLTSPLSHRACVAWSVCVVESTNFVSAARHLTITRSTPFELIGSDGTTIVEEIRCLDTARVAGQCREWKPNEETQHFFQSQGDEGRACLAYLERLFDSRNMYTPLICETIVPPQGRCHLIGCAYEFEPFVGPPEGALRRIIFNRVRALVGDRKSVAADFRRRQARRLPDDIARLVFVTGLLVFILYLVYVVLNSR